MMILVIIICYFAGLLLIAHITGHKGGSNAAFFKGENKSPWYIVSFGMIGATISGVTFVSVPGMVRGMDMTYMQTVFGFFFGYMIVAHILLPLYYRLNLTSIYGYLGTRIGVNAYPHRLFLLPALPYAGNGSQTVSRLSDPAYARISGYAHPFLGDCRRLRGPRVDIYPQKAASRQSYGRTPCKHSV